LKKKPGDSLLAATTRSFDNRSMKSPAVHLFSIGHSNHLLKRFIELLRQHEIEAIADIRRFPGSRKHPHFGKDSLQVSLRDAGIEYRWIEELGGRRAAKTGVESPNTGLRNASFRHYADYMPSPEFGEALGQLWELATERRTAMMCAEGLWWQCHRRLVSDYLLANGANVDHILPDGKLKPHELTPEARVHGGHVTYPAPKTLFPED
jgi:uncharacterized protein (DUF488 family)